MSAVVVLLGPQRLVPTVVDAVHAHAPEAFDAPHVAAITAGWEERELEHEELAEHLGARVVNLELFRRIEEVFKVDQGLLAGMRQRHDRIRRLRRLYDLRLDHALEAARALMSQRRPENEDGLLEREIDDAIDVVRLLDAQHLERVREVHAAFDEEWRPAEREHLLHHREEVHAVLAEAGALFLAGGHVEILINRLRLFDLVPSMQARPVFAWSAGAMTLTDRIVLFHDSPPQGRGNPEVFDNGLGLVPDVVALPHASRRLRLDDPVRVELFARRFEPGPCVAFDERTELVWDGTEQRIGEKTRSLRADGTVLAPGEAA